MFNESVLTFYLIVLVIVGLLAYAVAKIYDCSYRRKSKKNLRQQQQKSLPARPPGSPVSPEKAPVPVPQKAVYSSVPQKAAESGEKYPYEMKMLLTKAEYAFYVLLKKECDKNKFLICPKVRMEDFLTVTDTENKHKYRGYIKSRHIDFMICNSKLYLLAGIEPDDPSHWNLSAAETDFMKNKIFEKIKLPLFRVSVSSGSYEEQIAHIMDSIKNPINLVEG